MRTEPRIVKLLEALRDTTASIYFLPEDRRSSSGSSAPGYMVRHKVKPGITGWAQVNGCRGGDDLESMRRRTEYDLAYLRSWSIWLDLLIVMKTVKMPIFGDERAY